MALERRRRAGFAGRCPCLWRWSPVWARAGAAYRAPRTSHCPVAQLGAVPWAAAAKNGALAGQNAQSQAAGAADRATGRIEVSAATSAGADPTLCPDGAGKATGWLWLLAQRCC